MNTWGPYPTDLSDAEWGLVRPLLSLPNMRSRSKGFDYRRLVDTLLYLDKAGGPYRMPPTDLCKRGVTNKYLLRWEADGTWQKVLGALGQRVHAAAGRAPDPAVVIVDSQSAATAAVGGEGRGFDGGKLVKGRKRHIAVDGMGLLLAVSVTAANVADGVAAPRVLDQVAAQRGERLRLVVGDSRYNDRVLRWWLEGRPKVRLEVVSRPKGSGFVVLKRRWVAERTFAWLLANRRLSKDYERTVAASRAVVKLAGIRQMLRRLKRNPREESEIASVSDSQPQAA